MTTSAIINNLFTLENMPTIVGTACLTGGCLVTIVCDNARKAFPGLFLDQSVALYLTRKFERVYTLASNLVPQTEILKNMQLI